MIKKVMLAVSTLALAATAAPAFAQQNQDNDNATNGAAGGIANEHHCLQRPDRPFVQDNAAIPFRTTIRTRRQWLGHGNTAVVAIRR